MLRIIRSLGRLSISGYLIISGFVVMITLATYANLHDHQPIATHQPAQPATAQATTDTTQLNNAPNIDTTTETAPQTLGASSSEVTLPAQSSPVAKARHLTGSLVFTPANITLSLSHKLPSVTVTASDGAQITTPYVVSSSGGLGITAQKNSTDASPSWQLQLTGHPLLGVYQVNLAASSADTDYTGTMTVVVVL